MVATPRKTTALGKAESPTKNNGRIRASEPVQGAIIRSGCGIWPTRNRKKNTQTHPPLPKIEVALIILPPKPAKVGGNRKPGIAPESPRVENQLNKISKNFNRRGVHEHVTEKRCQQHKKSREQVSPIDQFSGSQQAPDKTS